MFSDQYPGIHLSVKNPISVVDYEKNQTDLMIGFAPITSDGLTFRPLGNLHFMPIVSKDYVERYGLPTRSNLEDHYFINSDLYSAQSGFWDRWTALTRRGTVRHSCDSSFSYAAMVKAGAGIGLLGSFTSLEPHSIPLALDTVIPVRLFLVANKERLAAKPVRIVHDWMSEIFGSENPWFSETLNLGQHDGKFDKGYKALFNLV